MSEGMIYECVRCGTKARGDKWERRGTRVFKCPMCGYKVAKKVRPPIVKRMKTK